MPNTCVSFAVLLLFLLSTTTALRIPLEPIFSSQEMNGDAPSPEWSVGGRNYNVELAPSNDEPVLVITVEGSNGQFDLQHNTRLDKGKVLSIHSPDCGFDGSAFSLVDSQTTESSPEIRIVDQKVPEGYFGSTVFDDADGSCVIYINVGRLIENTDQFLWDTLSWRSLSPEGFSGQVSSIDLSGL
jgi:hypothetical protein